MGEILLYYNIILLYFKGKISLYSNKLTAT